MPFSFWLSLVACPDIETAQPVKLHPLNTIVVGLSVMALVEKIAVSQVQALDHSTKHWKRQQVETLNYPNDVIPPEIDVLCVPVSISQEP